MFSYSNLSKHAGVIGPAIGVGVLVITILLLAVQATLRPWATDDYGSDTHLNTRDELNNYSRTSLTYVGDELAAPLGWMPSDAARDSAYPGYAAYVGYGCAACHGLDGSGTAVGPSINGASERRINNLVRQGPKQMPGYDDAHIIPGDLDLIVSYLTGRPEAPPTPEPFVRPTATPFPVPTATAAPTAVPTAVPATAVPGASPTATAPAATATPPQAAVDTARLNKARILFLDVGCDICHGQAGEGGPDGPALEDMTADYIRDFVRDPQRPANSRYSEAMDPFDEMALSDEELSEIIYFLLNRE